VERLGLGTSETGGTVSVIDRRGASWSDDPRSRALSHPESSGGRPEGPFRLRRKREPDTLTVIDTNAMEVARTLSV